MTTNGSTVDRLVVITTSSRVAPGLLSAAAWSALRCGLPVYAVAEHAQAAAVRAAGVEVIAAREPHRPGVWLLPEGATVPPDAEVVQGSHDLPGAHLIDAVTVMDRLRSPGGCPWDAEQTHESLQPYLLEEAYEAYQAIEDGNDDELREELGDLLLQVLFHARVAQEDRAGWSVDDVADGLVEKLVSRHPHVFADAVVADAAEVNSRWEEIKAEQKGRTSVTEGVPLAMAALALAAKLQRRAARLGTGPAAVFDAGAGFGGELWRRVGASQDGASRVGAAGGDADGDDAETALRAVARRFRDELAAAEASLSAAGEDPAAQDEAGWRAHWPGREAAPSGAAGSLERSAP